jgi:hypothetical protein
MFVWLLLKQNKVFEPYLQISERLEKNYIENIDSCIIDESRVIYFSINGEHYERDYDKNIDLEVRRVEYPINTGSNFINRFSGDIDKYCFNPINNNLCVKYTDVLELPEDLIFSWQIGMIPGNNLDIIDKVSEKNFIENIFRLKRDFMRFRNKIYKIIHGPELMIILNDLEKFVLKRSFIEKSEEIPDPEVRVLENCPICLDEIFVEDLEELLCGHYFHRNCINCCINRDIRTCPMCRAPF